MCVPLANSINVVIARSGFPKECCEEIVRNVAESDAVHQLFFSSSREELRRIVSAVAWRSSSLSGVQILGMGHGVAVSPEAAKRVLWACLTMPAAALAVRLYVDPVHQAHTHHAVELPMPPHVPPPVADFTEQQQPSVDSS